MSDPLPPDYDKAYFSIEKDTDEGNHHLSVQSNPYYGETEQDDVISVVVSMEKRPDGHLTDWVTMKFTAQEARLLASVFSLIADNADKLKASQAKNQTEKPA